MADTLSIMQFVATVSPGDGVTKSAFYVHRLLRELGHESGIFSHRPPFELRDDVQDIHRFDGESCDLLLVHHSMGHDLDTWLDKLTCPWVLIYHNITPAEYFHPQSGHHFYAQKGRQQLADWTTKVLSAVGVSPQNSAELEACGYASVSTLPLLVDPQLMSVNSSEPPFTIPEGVGPLILSVGRLVENKRQHLLIEAMAKLAFAKGSTSPGQFPLLVLVGETTNPDYEQYLRGLVDQYGLDRYVIFAGKLNEAHLQWLYQRAELYWCASEHEGFCMPLIEAAYHDLPVIAFEAPGITDTLGCAGLLLEATSPELMAAATAVIHDDSEQRDLLITAGKTNLERFEHDKLREQLGQFLDSLPLGANPIAQELKP
jgi:glycosyltransferase involved in cell wall biosynthesis